MQHLSLLESNEEVDQLSATLAPLLENAPEVEAAPEIEAAPEVEAAPEIEAAP